MPTLDELGQPLGDDSQPPRNAGLMRAGSVDDLPGLAADLAAFAPPDAWFVERPSVVHAHAFAAPTDQGSEVRVVFLVHPGVRRQTARLVVPPGTTLRDVVDGNRFLSDAGVATIDINPRDARMLIVES
jgi:hypothetical protein